MVYDQIDMKRSKSEGFADGVQVGLALGVLFGGAVAVLFILWINHML